MPPAYVEARAAMERGDLDAAAKAFEDQLAASPSDPVAKTGLSQVNLIRRVSSYDQARVRRDAAEHPADAEAQIRVADIDMASGRIEDAFDRLLGVIRRTSGEDRDKARVHLVGLFEILPPRDPRVTKARSTCPPCCSDRPEPGQYLRLFHEWFGRSHLTHTPHQPHFRNNRTHPSGWREAGGCCDGWGLRPGGAITRPQTRLRNPASRARRKSLSATLREYTN